MELQDSWEFIKSLNSEGRHYVRTSNGLTLRTLDKFTWGPRDVITDYISFDCLSGTPLRVYGWDVEYDFSADCSEIYMWPDANKGDTPALIGKILPG